MGFQSWAIVQLQRGDRSSRSEVWRPSHSGSQRWPSWGLTLLWLILAAEIVGICGFGNKESLGAEPTPEATLPLVSPAEAGLDATHLARIEPLIADALAQQKMPGCVVAIGRRGLMAWRKAYGQRTLLPQPEPMTVDTLFDLASLTKPMATATSVMILVDRGLVRLREPVASYIPEFAAEGKDRITVHDLLTHQAGLIADNPLGDYELGPDEAWRRIWNLEPKVSPRTEFIYSDVGFETLGEIVRRVSGNDVHAFSHDHIFSRLGMNATSYLPGSAWRSRSAPTEQREGRWMRGEVHDPRAYALGGVAGHAGLFSTADDLAIYASMMLGRGQWRGTRILSDGAWQAMTGPHAVPGGQVRGLGWDKQSGYSSNRGEWFSSQAFGHGGFTGTSLWIDPELDLFVIFLSNRVHPNGQGSVNSLAGKIGTIAAAALTTHRENSPIVELTSPASPSDVQAVRPNVLCGIDMLLQQGGQALHGRKIGLITNHTGRTAAGIATAVALKGLPGVELRALFSPEHGYQGALDVPHIEDSRDEATGLPVFSLYGETRSPGAESLANIDTLVFDIQDIGCRFYTYIATMLNAMRVAEKHGIQFVVLDRPNPINGLDVQGPLLDDGRESFVGCHSLPVRHGMTVGELARLFQAELRLNIDLKVISMHGWRRSMWWDKTGLMWVNPSPNMRSLQQALLYPGIGLLETTNLSVGRGTDTPFQRLGAPWIGGRDLARALGEQKLPGVTFVPVAFTPQSSKFANTNCEGIEIIVTDRGTFQPLRTGYAVAATLHRLYPNDWQLSKYNDLLGHRKSIDAITSGVTSADWYADLQGELERFQQRRSAVLLYGE